MQEEVALPRYISVSALLNQGPKPWFKETGLGAGAGVCLSSLACSPRFGTREGGETPKGCVKSDI